MTAVLGSEEEMLNESMASVGIWASEGGGEIGVWCFDSDCGLLFRWRQKFRHSWSFDDACEKAQAWRRRRTVAEEGGRTGPLRSEAV